MAVLVEVMEAKKPEANNEEEANKSSTKEDPKARQNWKKLFAVRKFMSLAKIQSKASPAELLIAHKYIVGKKIANGAFGQLRLGKDSENGTQVAIKLEPVNARIPMLFLEHRFYKVREAEGLFFKISCNARFYFLFCKSTLHSWHSSTVCKLWKFSHALWRKIS